MDEREQRILQTHQDFKELGVIADDGEDAYLDPEAAHSEMVQTVDDFEKDIADAYEKDKSRQTMNLGKAAQLRIMIDGGSDEELYKHIKDHGLSTRQSVAYRREEAIKAIKTVRDKAEKTRNITSRESELMLDAADYRSLDDTLDEILTRRGLSNADQGSIRLLFGLVALRHDEASPNQVMQWKSNAAGILRFKLTALEKSLPSSPRVKEGIGLMHRLVNRTRTGYPTVQFIAETIAYDKETRTKATYSDDIEQNQRMIETYLSEALDVMYPSDDPRS